MKPTKTILVCVLAAGLASAQSPSIIQNTRATMNGVSNNAAAATNQALSMSRVVDEFDRYHASSREIRFFR